MFLKELNHIQSRSGNPPRECFNYVLISTGVQSNGLPMSDSLVQVVEDR